jgi:alkylhydroperoxidase family enzyme
VTARSVADEVSRLGPLVDTLTSAVLQTPGATALALRRRAHDAHTDTEAFGTYLAKVRRHAYRVVDADIQELQAGLSDDAIFELTVAAALGEARRRLDAGLSLLQE